MIPYSRQDITEKETKELVDVLGSDWLTTGPKIEEFEDAVADYCGARYAVAVSNGTAALHLSALALGIKKGDEGITSPNTFLASANCIAFCQGIPRFADIDPVTYCINPQKIENAITEKTRVLIPVHFAGQPCDMESIEKIAEDKKLYIIEDAAHALGSKWKDKKGNWHKVGSCSHSHITILSFHPVKTITTGERGMILTNDKKIADKCRLLRSHGITRNPSKSDNADKSQHQTPGAMPFYYEMHKLGYNYRLTDFQCALGLIQLKRLDEFIKQRREIWDYYTSELKDINGFNTPTEREGVHSAWHLYAAQVVEKRDELFNYLRKKDIGAHAMYIPVHLQPYYQKKYGYKKGDFLKAETYFKKCLILPMFHALKESEVEYIVKTVKGFFQ